MDTPGTLIDKDQERVDDLYDALEARAREAYFAFFSTRTPPELQDLMTAKVEAGLPGQPAVPPLQPNEHIVRNGDSVRVVDQSNAQIVGSPGTARVAAGLLIDIKILLT